MTRPKTFSPAARSARYTVEAISREDMLPALEADWDRISTAAALPNVFTTFDWFTAWYRHFAPGDGEKRLKPHVLVLRDDGAVRGIAPLTCATTMQFGMRLRRLQFAGRDHEWDYNDLVIGDDQDGLLDAVAEQLRSTQHEWELADLMDVRDVDGSVERIEDAMRRAGLRCTRLPVEERCPYMTIDGSWEQMLSQRSRATRHSHRNRAARQKKIAGDGLRVRIVPQPHLEPELLERMIALEAQKQYGGAPSAPFVGPRKETFESILRTLGPKGWLCATLLEWDERLLAWQLLFRCGPSLWGYMTAYDHSSSYLSPGSTLLAAAYDYGHGNDFLEFDFLSGEEAYKLQWATGYHERARLLIWNDRWKSRLYAAAYARRRRRVPSRADVEENGNRA